MLRTGLRGKFCGLLATASSFAMLASAVSAQPAELAQQDMETVSVTGSLIANSSFTAPTPVTALNSEEIASKAAGSVFEIIRNIPSFNATSGPTANSTGAQNASKANLNLRNLGSTDRPPLSGPFAMLV